MMNSWKPWRVCCPGMRGALRSSMTDFRRVLRHDCWRRAQGQIAPCLRIKHLYRSWSPLKESRLDEHES